MSTLMTIRRRLSFCLALGALLLASGCDEGGGSSHSDSGSAPAASSAAASSTSSNPPANTPPAPPSGTPGVLEASWGAPTMNTDGSPLTDLAFYRLYYGNAGTPCPGSAFVQIASPTSSPQSNDTLTYTLTGLSIGTRYFVAVTAMDSSDIESGCSSVASAVARSGGAAGGLVGGTASNTFAWTPSTSNPNYAVAVRVRSAGSTADQTDTGTYRVIAFAIN